MELILDLVYIYIGIFSIYFFVLAIKSLNDRKFRLDKKYAMNAEQEVLCVVLYSHNNYEALKSMLNQLKHQTYSVQNFIIQVILDNCNDHSADLISDSNNIRVLNLNDGVTVGKDQAISILLENFRQDSFIDSYVFIDTNRYIEEDFLENVNRALTVSPVVTGQTLIIENDNATFSDKVKLSYNNYLNNFIRKSRALMGFSDKIDGSFLAIKKIFVEKVDSLDIQDINCELKYSVLLTNLGYPSIYVPDLKTYVKAYDYEIKKPSLSYRIKLFKQCFTKMFTFNYKFTEHVLSLIAPNALTVVLLSGFYLALSLKYYFLFNFIFVFTIFSLLMLGFAISVLKAGFTAKEFLYLAFYPIYSIGHILNNLPPYRFIKKYLFKSGKQKDVQKYSVKVMATNGKSSIPCKLDLISENGMARVIFTFKNKKFKSSKQIRIVEALKELTSKLSDYGFSLKICFCCEYFTSIVDGTTNMVQGECSFDFADKKPNDILTTLLWNSCSACKPRKMMSVIDDINLN